MFTHLNPLSPSQSISQDLEKFPPIRPGKLRIIIIRDPFDDQVTIHLPNGNSEYLPADRAELLLRSNGVKEPIKVLDHVYNWNKATLFLNDPTVNQK